MGKILGYLFLYLVVQSIALDLLQIEGLIEDITFHLLWVTALVGFIYIVTKQKMFVYVAKRGFEAFVTVFVIATVTFLLLRTIPGGPFDSDKALPPEIIANINAKYNLDKPLIQQYLIYITDIFRGDLGFSYKYIGRSVSDIISESFPASFKLGFYSLIIAYIMGIPLGLYAAARHNTWWDSF
jgi:oligopeptide transport system permease protein